MWAVSHLVSFGGGFCGERPRPLINRPWWCGVEAAPSLFSGSPLARLRRRPSPFPGPAPLVVRIGSALTPVSIAAFPIYSLRLTGSVSSLRSLFRVLRVSADLFDSFGVLYEK